MLSDSSFFREIRSHWFMQLITAWRNSVFRHHNRLSLFRASRFAFGLTITAISQHRGRTADNNQSAFALAMP